MYNVLKYEESRNEIHLDRPESEGETPDAWFSVPSTVPEHITLFGNLWEEQNRDRLMPIEGFILVLRLQTEGVLKNPDELAI